MSVVRFDGEGKQRGDRGVKRRGECGAISGRGGDVGAVRVHARGGAGGCACAVGCPRKKKLGRAHVVLRGEGGGGLGRLENKS
jgi:hypothetical protein